VGQPVAPPPDSVRDVAIEAALVAFDDARSQSARRDELARARAKRARAARGLRIVSVAAAVLLVVLAVPLLIGSMDTGSDDSADMATGAASDGDGDTAEDAGAEATGGDREAPDGLDPAAGGGELGAASYFADLGEAEDAEQLESLALRATQRAADAPAADESATTAAASERNAARFDACRMRAVDQPGDHGVLLLEGNATLDDRPVRVYLFRDGDQWRVIATDSETCEVVADRRFIA
jgi:hypothetical protein